MSFTKFGKFSAIVFKYFLLPQSLSLQKPPAQLLGFLILSTGTEAPLTFSPYFLSQADRFLLCLHWLFSVTSILLFSPSSGIFTSCILFLI